MQVLALFSNKDFWQELWELMSREWSTLDEYHEKYSKMLNTTVAFITFEARAPLITLSKL
jgi:hypothetical protein